MPKCTLTLHAKISNYKPQLQPSPLTQTKQTPPPPSVLTSCCCRCQKCSPSLMHPIMASSRTRITVSLASRLQYRIFRTRHLAASGQRQPGCSTTASSFKLLRCKDNGYNSYGSDYGDHKTVHGQVGCR
jgi:hypothetical protein